MNNFRQIYQKVLFMRDSSDGAGTFEKIDSQKASLEHSLLQRDILLTEISGVLKSKIGELSISLDLNPFEQKLKKNLDEILLSDKIPFIAKRKFIDDIKMKVEKYFSRITVEDISNLREIRNRNSLGASEHELRGKTEKEIQTFHLNMILESNLETYIGGSVAGLREAFLAESEKQNGGEYSKKGLDEYAKMISEADTRYGLSMSTIAKESKERANKAGVDLMQAGLFLDMRLALITELAKKDPEFAKKQTNLISTLNYNPAFNIQYNSSMTVRLGGKSYLLRDIVNDYAKVNSTWHQREHEIRDARAIAISDNILSKTKKALGTEQLRSEFDKITEGEMENMIKNSSLADIMIMVTQVAQIIPALGDILGGVMDTSDAIYGMNAKGEKFTRMERIGSGILGGLSIVIVGGLINRARKGPKYTKMLELLAKYLPANIEKFQKMGGEFTKDMKEKILKFTRDIGATTLGQRMQGMFENRLTTGFTEQQKNTGRLVEKTSGIELSPEKLEIKSKAEKVLREAGFIKPEEHLSDTQVELIFAGHNVGKPIGQQDFGSIRDKARASSGLPIEWKRVLMREGVMGGEVIDRLNVVRKNRVVSIGDLHGSYDAFMGNLISAHIVDQSGNWIGGTSQVVFHGDILADRSSQGLKILENIDRLRAEAIAAGGKIHLLAGNHDDFAFAHLTDNRISVIRKGIVKWFPVEGVRDSAQGLEEFNSLNKLRATNEGRVILDRMCRMKIVTVIDDTLFMHVVPNDQIIGLINTHGVDNINIVYQKCLRHYLLGKGNLTQQDIELFNTIRGTFLNSDSRSLGDSGSEFDKLRKTQGINHIIHGHDNGFSESPIFGTVKEQGGIHITGSDNDYRRPDGSNKDKPSIVIIETNARMHNGSSTDTSLLSGTPDNPRAATQVDVAPNVVKNKPVVIKDISSAIPGDWILRRSSSSGDFEIVQFVRVGEGGTFVFKRAQNGGDFNSNTNPIKILRTGPTRPNLGDFGYTTRGNNGEQTLRSISGAGDGRSRRQVETSERSRNISPGMIASAGAIGVGGVLGVTAMIGGNSDKGGSKQNKTAVIQGRNIQGDSRANSDKVELKPIYNRDSNNE